MRDTGNCHSKRIDSFELGASFKNSWDDTSAESPHI
jgi:hypothetical protein